MQEWGERSNNSFRSTVQETISVYIAAKHGWMNGVGRNTKWHRATHSSKQVKNILQENEATSCEKCPRPNIEGEMRLRRLRGGGLGLGTEEILVRSI